MHAAEPEAETQFSQPVRQILTMLVVIGLVGTGAWFAFPQIGPIFLTNPWLNGVIILVFLIGVASCFWQVASLFFSVSWIEGFVMNRAGHEFVRPPRLLASLATLLRARRASMHISATSSRSILDSMATRLDETREITRYIINLLIFLGLLGTFYGLATTVPAVVDTIRSLAPTEGEDGVAVFGRLMTGLERQLGGMGTAFASSLLGLAGSLVVGLLDLFTGHGQGRFYRELEEWLSTITQVGLSGDGEGAAALDLDGPKVALYQTAEAVEALHQTFIRAEETQTRTTEQLAALTGVLAKLGERLERPPPGQGADMAALAAAQEKAQAAAREMLEEQNRLLARIIEGQQEIAAALAREEAEPADAESRMRLRSIDVQLLRILEEMSAGRQDVVTELRTEIAGLSKAVRSLGRKPPVQPAVQRAGKV